MGIDDYANYLAVMVFGTNDEPLRRYVNRAYRDLSRTLHTDGSGDSRTVRVDGCRDVLIKRLKEAREHGGGVTSQESFDAWHDRTCADLVGTFGEGMFYGHAQKWVNMSLEYLFTAHGLGLEDIGEIATWYRGAHLPVDRVIVEALYRDGFAHEPRPTVWSQLDEASYVAFQKSVCEFYKEECRMDIDFRLWREGTAARRTAARQEK
jgi:hypothetical protein